MHPIYFAPVIGLFFFVAVMFVKNKTYNIKASWPYFLIILACGYGGVYFIHNEWIQALILAAGTAAIGFVVQNNKKP